MRSAFRTRMSNSKLRVSRPFAFEPKVEPEAIRSVCAASIRVYRVYERVHESWYFS